MENTGPETMATLVLVPIYVGAGRSWVNGLTVSLGRTFQLAVRIRPPWFDPEIPFDPSRGQYSSTLFLEQLLSIPGDETSRVLGITGVDLFIPVLTYVFGEAQLGGRAAIVSLHRLRNEIYGLHPDQDLLARRLEKESIHELGHTFGLTHCLDSRCVMHASTYVEEIDLKSSAFCDLCLQTIRPSV